MAPAKPKLVKGADTPSYQTWDQYVEESLADLEPYRLALPAPAEVPDGYVPEVVEVPCPTGDQMDALNAAQRAGDDAAGFIALFGPDVAARLLAATQGLPFIVRAKLMGGVMQHYGQQATPT
jgi:hypothetical protein